MQLRQLASLRVHLSLRHIHMWNMCHGTDSSVLTVSLPPHGARTEWMVLYTPQSYTVDAQRPWPVQYRVEDVQSFLSSSKPCWRIFGSAMVELADAVRPEDSWKSASGRPRKTRMYDDVGMAP